MTGLAQRIAEVRGRIGAACEKAGRDPASVELLPVSKHQPLELISEAANLGFKTFGENYVQEGAAKAAAKPDLHFVLLGPLQRNKAKAALQHFHEIQTLDRVDLAMRLGPLAEELNLVRGVWIQVDLWNEATKEGGCPEPLLSGLVEALRDQPRLPLRGFMALPPPGMPAAFQEMSVLREAWQQMLGHPLRLSLGMSQDMEDAVAAGADQVRIGTSLFGERHTFAPGPGGDRGSYPSLPP